MELTKELAELLCDFEYLVGAECHQEMNPLVYDDLEYRYPVKIPMPGYEDEFLRIKKNVKYVSDLDPCNIKYSFYQMGKNQIHIGRALCQMMDILEKRYNIDFNALEDNRNKTTVNKVNFVRKEEKHVQTFSYIITKDKLKSIAEEMSQEMDELESLKMILGEVLPENITIDTIYAMEVLGGRRRYRTLIKNVLSKDKHTVCIKIIGTCVYETNLYGEHFRECVIDSIDIK